MHSFVISAAPSIAERHTVHTHNTRVTLSSDTSINSNPNPILILTTRLMVVAKAQRPCACSDPALVSVHSPLPNSLPRPALPQPQPLSIPALFDDESLRLLRRCVLRHEGTTRARFQATPHYATLDDFTMDRECEDYPLFVAYDHQTAN